MTWFEWVLIAWLILAALLGWKSGFIFMAGSLIGFLVSLWVAAHYGATVAGWVGGGAWGSVLSNLGLILLVTKLCGLLALLIDKFAKITYIIPFVKSFNRLGGIILSVATHLMIASLVAFLVHSIILEHLITQPWSEAMVSFGGLIAGALPTAVGKFL